MPVVVLGLVPVSGVNDPLEAAFAVPLIRGVRLMAVDHQDKQAMPG